MQRESHWAVHSVALRVDSKAVRMAAEMADCSVENSVSKLAAHLADRLVVLMVVRKESLLADYSAVQKGSR